MSNLSRRFIIVAPSYSERIGGAIVLHKLCFILKELGYESYLYPFYKSEIVNFPTLRSSVAPIVKMIAKNTVEPFKLSKKYPVRTIAKNDVRPTDIVLYPDIVIGNPLTAKNVIRYFLYTPGGQNGVVSISPTDLVVDFRNFLEGWNFGLAAKYPEALYITDFPTEIYNENGALPHSERFGTAYCMRKGSDRIPEHDISTSVLIDNLPHKDIAKIFKRVKTFYSYDPYTAYNAFASLCGADSIVVPLPGISKEEWLPGDEKRYGIAYGTEDLAFARATRGALLRRISTDEVNAINQVDQFARFAREFFHPKMLVGATAETAENRVQGLAY